MTETTEQIRDAVWQALRELEQQREPKQNVVQIYSGTIPANGHVSLPTSGEEMLLIVSGSVSTAKMYVVFAKTSNPPAAENVGGASVYTNAILLYYNSNRYCALNLPVRSEYITLLSGGAVVDFIVIFHTRNMGVHA